MPWNTQKLTTPIVIKQTRHVALYAAILCANLNPRLDKMIQRVSFCRPCFRRQNDEFPRYSLYEFINMDRNLQHTILYLLFYVVVCCFGETTVDKFWWKHYVGRSELKGPIYLLPLPFAARTTPAEAVLDLLCMSGAPAGFQATIVDVGLPDEAQEFRKFGHKVVGFEARKAHADRLTQTYLEDGDVTMIHSALSNYSGNTVLFDAYDSSSLLKTAVSENSVASRKWEGTGNLEEIVPVEILDTFVRECDAIKIDVQGNEPEVLMGAHDIFHHARRSPVVFMEYCTKLREKKELMIGLHLLRGLGYTCYWSRSDFVYVTESMNFCGDVYCSRHLLTPIDVMFSHLPAHCVSNQHK